LSLPNELGSYDLDDWQIDEWEMDRDSPGSDSVKRISNKFHPPTQPIGQYGLIDKHYKWEGEQD